MSDEPEAGMADEPADDEEPVATETESTESASDSDGLADGDFVTLAYTARTAEDGTLVDTTDQEIAEEEGVAEEGQTFEPRTIVLGAGHIFDAVEDAIIGSEVGDSGEVTVPAADAFGEYDEESVRTVSADKLPEDERYPGAHVDIDGEHGHVVSVIGGRARVDFNHPLAGEDVVYEFEVTDTVSDPEERAQALLSMYVDADLELWIETDEVEEEVVVESDEDEDEESDGSEGEEGQEGETDEDEPAEPETEIQTVEKETLYVESTPQLSFNQQWMFQKQQIAQDIMDRLDLDRVIIQETIDGSGGMMGGMGGMMGGMGGMGGGLEELEEEIEDAGEEGEIDAEGLVEELEADDAEE